MSCPESLKERGQCSCLEWSLYSKYFLWSPLWWGMVMWPSFGQWNKRGSLLEASRKGFLPSIYTYLPLPPFFLLLDIVIGGCDIWSCGNHLVTMRKPLSPHTESDKLKDPRSLRLPRLLLIGDNNKFLVPNESFLEENTGKYFNHLGHCEMSYKEYENTITKRRIDKLGTLKFRTLFIKIHH